MFLAPLHERLAQQTDHDEGDDDVDEEDHEGRAEFTIENQLDALSKTGRGGVPRHLGALMPLSLTAFPSKPGTSTGVSQVRRGLQCPLAPRSPSLLPHAPIPLTAIMNISISIITIARGNTTTATATSQGHCIFR